MDTRRTLQNELIWCVSPFPFLSLHPTPSQSPTHTTLSLPSLPLAHRPQTNLNMPSSRSVAHASRPAKSQNTKTKQKQTENPNHIGKTTLEREEEDEKEHSHIKEIDEDNLQTSHNAAQLNKKREENEEKHVRKTGIRIRRTVASVCGKEIDARKVFVEALSYIRSCSIRAINRKLGSNVLCTRGDVQWVLTVPGIWSNKAKQLMRKWAMEAKLTYGHERRIPNHLIIVSELRSSIPLFRASPLFRRDPLFL